MVPMEVLKQAQSTIALLQTYVAALASGYPIIAAFFAYKYIGALVEGAKSSTAEASSNEKIATAMDSLTKAVLALLGKKE